MCILLMYVCHQMKNEAEREQENKGIAEMLLAATNLQVNPTNFKPEDSCCICLDNFKPDENVIVLPCDRKHVFHASCIADWVKRNNNCPLCKQEVTIQAIQSAVVGNDNSADRSNDPNMKNSKFDLYLHYLK